MGVAEGVPAWVAIASRVRARCVAAPAGVGSGFRLGLVGPFSIVDQAGVDIYASCYGILEAAFGERMATPATLTDAVAAGAHGTKVGRGLLGAYDDDALEAMRDYRERAYVQ